MAPRHSATSQGSPRAAKIGSRGPCYRAIAPGDEALIHRQPKLRGQILKLYSNAAGCVIVKQRLNELITAAQHKTARAAVRSCGLGVALGNFR